MIRLSGRFRSALIVGGQGIRARKLRTLLSMLSLFLGVLAVVAVQAGAEIGRRAVLADVELNEGIDGTVVVSVPPQPQVVPLTLEALKGRTDAVGTFGIRAIIGEPGVVPVNQGGIPFDALGRGFEGAGGPAFPDAPDVFCDPSGVCRKAESPGGVDRVPRGQAIELIVTALTGDIRRFRPFRLQSGGWLDFAAAPSLAPRIVLNREAAKGFRRYQVPAEMRVEGASANPTPQVIGVVDDARYEPVAYVRADELLNWIPPAKVSDPERGQGMELLLAPSANDVERTLRARMVAAGLPEQAVHARQVRSKEDLAKELALVRWIFLGMAGLVLLIGVAGILNVGLATVGERVEEFALRRAVGTPRSLLAAIVLAETLLTGLFTAGAAIGVAALGLKVISGLVGPGQDPFLQNLAFPWQAGVAGVVAGLVAGLLGGLIPAVRAARIPIATVMRA